ncbi:MAG: hypothetical protein U0930_26235 [Pirellulales bacterium]
MAAITRNAFVSQAVLWTACVITGVGLFFDQSRIIFATGLTLASSGMVQSYYGSVFEIERSKRFWYLAIGVPLAVGSGFVAFLSLNDYLSTWGMIAQVVVATIEMQLLISWFASHLWLRWYPQDNTGVVNEV